jgi:hypothetical protein
MNNKRRQLGKHYQVDLPAFFVYRLKCRFPSQDLAMKNPLPILTRECGIKLGTVARVLGNPHMDLGLMHNLARVPSIKPAYHRKLFDLTMTEWGQCSNARTRQLLWDCYFPGTKPHVYHLLHYVHQVPIETLVEHSRLPVSTIEHRVLRRPKLRKRHLRSIARYAMSYVEALASKKQLGGRDPRYAALQRALVDPSRLYDHGEMSQD